MAELVKLFSSKTIRLAPAFAANDKAGFPLDKTVAFVAAGICRTDESEPESEVAGSCGLGCTQILPNDDDLKLLC